MWRSSGVSLMRPLSKSNSVAPSCRAELSVWLCLFFPLKETPSTKECFLWFSTCCSHHSLTTFTVDWVCCKTLWDFSWLCYILPQSFIKIRPVVSPWSRWQASNSPRYCHANKGQLSSLLCCYVDLVRPLTLVGMLFTILAHAGARIAVYFQCVHTTEQRCIAVMFWERIWISRGDAAEGGSDREPASVTNPGLSCVLRLCLSRLPGGDHTPVASHINEGGQMRRLHIYDSHHECI